MKQWFLFAALLIAATGAIAQHSPAAATEWETIYRESPTLVNNLVHTKLQVRFDYNQSYLYGKAWITLKPHFYPTDSLTLDAKGMEIRQVALARGTATQPLKFEYDGKLLRIRLGKTFTRHESYTVYIDYIAKPDEYDSQGSAAITDAKGLYFINPRGEEKDKPTQIWTQGETEATSVWCPTIDRPNQRTTQEIAMTVPAKYVTLSNGQLVSQKKNNDGTRTDTWKMDLPHAPYLFFMGVGEYTIVKDRYKGKEVSYYVEKKYAPVARKIFGNTVEMLGFFEKILGVPYVWNKYAQIVGRDYVSGAMENTTAVLHQESAQQDARQLVDGNIWENTIAHEVVHHWFGNLVTLESWSNLTLNESFANYSEYLWQEHKYGKDAADEHAFTDMHGYLRGPHDQKDLVRFYYTDKEAMFDAVSYNKGGRILHMLRNYVGDSAFFKALNVFLEKHKFGTAEAHQLRLAFENVTGKDMNWFWNQWYFGSGHPVLKIDYEYDDAAGIVKVIVEQAQEKVFRLPIAVDIYHGEKKTRHSVWLRNQTDTLVFTYTQRPDLVNVDGDKILLAQKTDNKTLENFIHQYKYAGSYLDRREAIDFAMLSTEPAARALIRTAMNDKYAGLRTYTIENIDIRDAGIRREVEPVLFSLSSDDPKSLVRAAALELLGFYQDEKYKDLFLKGINDSSYSVAGAALEGLMRVDSAAAVAEAKKLNNSPAKGKLLEALTKVMIYSGDENAFDGIVGTFDNMPLSQSKFNLLVPLSEMLARLNDTEKVKKGIDLMVEFKMQLPEEYGLRPYVDNLLNRILVKKQAAPDQGAVKDQIDYIKDKLSNP